MLTYLEEELGMSTAVDNTFPLTPIALTKMNSLQKKSTSHLPPKKSQDLIMLDNIIEPEPNTFWEKGIFIDLYI